MAARDKSDESEISLANLPPTTQQRRLAFISLAALLAAFAVTVPFADIPLPQLPAIIPTFEAILCVNDLITAALLFTQFSIVRSRALLILASGYLFTALIVIPHALTFPGAFSPTGLLGAGLQSTVWLYFFWHMGFPATLLIYALLIAEDPARHRMQVSTQFAVGWSVAIVISLVCTLAWLATVENELLPRLMVSTTRVDPLTNYVATFTLLICALALALLLARRRSVLDLWLIVVACASISELVLAVVLISARFSFGWYSGRLFSLVTSVVVLVVLLAQTSKLYAHLARSNTTLQRERNSKLVNMEAMAASIAHEVKQPLAAIVTNASAGLRWLERTPPNIEEARSAFRDIIGSGNRASEIFDSIRALFRTSHREEQPIDVNEIALGALHILRGDLKEHGVTTHTELTTELPRVMGHRGQLQEVMLNLVRNAIEAMDAIESGDRALQVRTRRNGREAIAVVVEDSGPGIDPEKLDGIFDALVTTKPQGTGLGLAICRMIIEHHGGQISAWSSKKRSGALFQFILPIKSAEGSTGASL